MTFAQFLAWRKGLGWSRKEAAEALLRLKRSSISKPVKARPELDDMIKASISAFESLSPEEKRAHRKAQRISWVYGNLAIDNPAITREMVEKAAEDWP